MAQKIKYVLIAVLFVLSVLVIIPPIHYGYIYPTAGDDTASHLLYFQNIQVQTPLYYGAYLVGNVINNLPMTTQVSFLWFHFVVMVSALWVVGICTALTVNWIAGILAVFLVFGWSYLPTLFYWGQIFDIVGIAVLLPIALLCLHKMDNGIGWKVGAMCSLIVFSVFHLNGKGIYVLLPVVVIYEIITYVYRNKVELRKWRYLIYTGSLGICYFVASVTNYPLDIGRAQMDSSVLLIICLSGLVSLVLWKRKVLVHILAIIIAIVIAVPNLIQWMGNNSAVKDADKEAIIYLNSLGGESYTADPNVAEGIYNLFLDKTFRETVDADYAVIRTVPMTPRSDPDSYYYENSNRESIVDYMGKYELTLLKEFDDGEKDRLTGAPIVVQVYGK